ncbi:autotransporter-associated beta strand repeat-containing protein [Microvirga sp. TS319]|uniref:autotransporter-associated beta strand repeat-containing protein n=1 Tax=Microvirga sp. TS319 TaxID=3241165 RepID=UPI00351A0906
MQGNISLSKSANVSHLRYTQALLAGASLAVLALASPARAGTIIYSDGQSAVAPVAMATDTELNVATGSADQRGTVSGAYHVTKTGDGIPLLSGTGALTLTAADTLVLAEESHVSVDLRANSNQASFSVAGDLTLDGALSVKDVGGFGPGSYRLFNYGGSLTQNGLDIATVPNGSRDKVSVQTAVAGQVNLAARGEQQGPLLFWDGDKQENWDNGKVDGGDGQWRTGGRAFTDAQGVTNGAMSPRPGSVGFGGNAGNVEVYTGTGQVETTGMQFATSGYNLYGDLLTLAAGEAIIRVGDGTAAGANYVATISNRLDGGGRLTKTDLGTLILDGDNNYWGGTEIRQGTLQIGSGGTSGSIVGEVVNNGALAFNRSDATTFDGAISGTGAVHLLDGDLTLTGTNRYTGGTIVDGGILRAGQEKAFVSDTAFTVNGGTLDLNDYSLIMSSLSGTGGLVAIGTATHSLHQNIDTSFAGSLTGSGYFTKGGAVS